MTARAAFFLAPGETVAVEALTICRPPDALRFIADAARGDRHAARVLVAVNDALHRLDAAPRRSPMLCAACPAPIRPEVSCSFVLHMPEDERVLYNFALGICRRCGTSRADVRRRAVQALRRELPDLRLVGLTHVCGGRA